MLKNILNSFFIKASLTLLICFCVYKFLSIFIVKRVIKKIDKNNSLRIKRFITITKLIQNLIKYITFITGIFIILVQLGIKVETLVTGLGTLTLILGLASQDIIKDFLAGIFIILDNEFYVGEIVQIGTFKGEVIELGLRNTRIKNNDGEIKIIANRNITDIINFSISDDIAAVKLNVPYSITEEEFKEIINSIKEDLIKSPDVRKNSKIIFYGIQRLKENAYVYKVGISCKPIKRANVERLFLSLIKDYCLGNNIEIFESEEK